MSSKQTIQAIAVHLGERLDLSQIRKNNKQGLLRREQSFLLYKLAEDNFLYIKDYGSVVFMGVEDAFASSMKAYLGKVPKIRPSNNEKYEVDINADKAVKVDFNKITLTRLDQDLAHVVMLHLAQSVALEYYNSLSFDLLEDTRKYGNQLEEKGTISLSRKKMQKVIGKTMNLKNRIAENLFIFDTPQVAWKNEQLADLDKQLIEELDMKDRHYALQQNLDLFKDLLQHNHSSLLEWIIILLILFEVIQVIIEKII